MAAASETRMAELHELTATVLIGVLKTGVPIIHKETGEVTGHAPAPAPYIAAAIKFLKDNDITALPEANDKLKSLANALPDFDDEEGLHARH